MGISLLICCFSTTTPTTPPPTTTPTITSPTTTSSTTKPATTTPRATTPTFLNAPNCLSSLSLDTQFIHLIHVKEKWDIQVEVEAAGEIFKETFQSCDKVEMVKTYVKEESTSLIDFELHHGSKFVRANP